MIWGDFYASDNDLLQNENEFFIHVMTILLLDFMCMPENSTYFQNVCTFLCGI